MKVQLTAVAMQWSPYKSALLKSSGIVIGLHGLYV